MVKNAINAAITVLVGLAGVFGCCCGMLFSVAAVVESVFSKIQKMVKAHLWVLLWHAFQRCGRRRISIFEDPEDGQGTSLGAAVACFSALRPSSNQYFRRSRRWS